MKKKNNYPVKRGRYPKYVYVDASNVDLEAYKAKHDGKLPSIAGRKYKYPAPEDEEKWRVLLARAYTERNKERYCFHNNLTYPRHKHWYKFCYVLTESLPKARKERSQRTLDRRKLLPVGHPGRVHHERKTHATPLDKSKIHLLTHCQHMRMHGWKCEEEK